jgi:hypothetical protein
MVGSDAQPAGKQQHQQLRHNPVVQNTRLKQCQSYALRPIPMQLGSSKIQTISLVGLSPTAPNQSQALYTRSTKHHKQVQAFYSCIPESLEQCTNNISADHRPAIEREQETTSDLTLHSHSPITLSNYTSHSPLLSTSHHHHNTIAHSQQHPKASTASHPPTPPKTTTLLSPYPTAHYSHEL